MGRPGSRYLPAEDTHLLRDALARYSGEACLEIGFGSGTLVSTLSRRFGLAVGTDVQQLGEAKIARSPGVDLLLADRAGCFREGSFDLVFFNPPYLPSQGIVDRTTDGGRGGIEVPLSFLEEALRVLRRGGEIVVLLSREGDVEGFLERCARMGLEADVVAERRLFFENLAVFRLKRREPRT